MKQTNNNLNLQPIIDFFNDFDSPSDVAKILDTVLIDYASLKLNGSTEVHSNLYQGDDLRMSFKLRDAINNCNINN